jgi:uncharacterized protein YbaR (Trm112 family)
MTFSKTLCAFVSWRLCVVSSFGEQPGRGVAEGESKVSASWRPCVAWAALTGLRFGLEFFGMRSNCAILAVKSCLQEAKMIDQKLLEILRCPVCVHDKPDGGKLELVRDGKWLVCQDCGRKYPIRDDIPVMLIEEGDKWRDTPVEELPEPEPLVKK